MYPITQHDAKRPRKTQHTICKTSWSTIFSLPIHGSEFNGTVLRIIQKNDETKPFHYLSLKQFLNKKELREITFSIEEIINASKYDENINCEELILSGKNRNTRVTFKNIYGKDCAKIVQNRHKACEMNLSFEQWQLIQKALKYFYQCYSFFTDESVSPFDILNKAVLILMRKHVVEIDEESDNFDLIFGSLYPDAKTSFTPAERKASGWLLTKNLEHNYFKETFAFLSTLFRHNLQRNEKQQIKQIILEAMANSEDHKSELIYQALEFFLQ